MSRDSKEMNTHPTECLKLQRLRILSIGKDAECSCEEKRKLVYTYAFSLLIH